MPMPMLTSITLRCSTDSGNQNHSSRMTKEEADRDQEVPRGPVLALYEQKFLTPCCEERDEVVGA